MIEDLQGSGLPESCTNVDGACSRAMQVPYVIFGAEFTIYMLFALLLLADSWLAYKTALVTGVGIYFMSFLQMCFKSGRPFWDVAEISSNGHCLFDFSGPSHSAFIMTFFWPYVQIMFLAKYYRSPSKFINWILLAVLLIFWVDIFLFSIINGLNYIYQIVIGQLLGFCYLVMCLVFDTELHRYSLRTGFSMRSSRARKFYLFFFLLGLLVGFLVYYYSIVGVWNMP